MPYSNTLIMIFVLGNKILMKHEKLNVTQIVFIARKQRDNGNQIMQT